MIEGHVFYLFLYMHIIYIYNFNYYQFLEIKSASVEKIFKKSQNQSKRTKIMVNNGYPLDTLAYHTFDY